MNIDLLSKMIKELILDNDRVTLPGMGAFVAEIVPSTFTDKGYTITPPYRRLYFRSGKEEDMLLSDFYARQNGVAPELAENIVRDFVMELRQVLQTKKIIIFPGLGKLRATKENNFFFVADEDLDIYPEGFGLESISLKTHEETTETIAAAVENLKSMLDEDDALMEQAGMNVQIPEGIPAETEYVDRQEAVRSEEKEEKQEDENVESVETENSENAGETGANPEKEAVEEASGERQAKKRRIAVIVAVSIIILILLLFGVFILLAKICPDFIDSLLYTREELEILNY